MKKTTSYLLIGLGLGLSSGVGIGWACVKEYYEDICKKVQQEYTIMRSRYMGDMIKAGLENGVLQAQLDMARGANEVADAFDSLSQDFEDSTRHMRDIRETLEQRASQKVDYHNFASGLGYNRGDKPTLEEMQEDIVRAELYEAELAEREYPDGAGYSADEDESLFGEELFALPPKDANGWRLPYPISEHDFAYGNDSQEKVTVMYFCEDDTLMDTDESVMDISSTCGREAIMLFEKDPDIDTVYARNEKLGIDYEITRNWGSYNATIMGIGADDDDDRRGWR